MPARSVPTGGRDLSSTLGSLAFLPGDPTVGLRPGRFERATVTPAGVGAIACTWGAGSGETRVEAFGDGADWLLERAPRLLGCEDDVAGFEPDTQPLRDLWRRRRHDRIPRTATLWHDLAWFIVQQRVSRTDAAQHWRRLVTERGTPAPGLGSLMAPPGPATVAAMGYPEFHPLGIEQQRAEHLRHAARAVGRLEAQVDGGSELVMPRLRAVAGVGPWTASCLAAQTWGERDAVIVGDAGIPALVAWLLAREVRADDTRLVELLEPYRPHRQRVVRLALASDARPPRRRPRAAGHDIRRR